MNFLFNHLYQINYRVKIFVAKICKFLKMLHYGYRKIMGGGEIMSQKGKNKKVWEREKGGGVRGEQNHKLCVFFGWQIQLWQNKVDKKVTTDQFLCRFYPLTISLSKFEVFRRGGREGYISPPFEWLLTQKSHINTQILCYYWSWLT